MASLWDAEAVCSDCSAQDALNYARSFETERVPRSGAAGGFIHRSRPVVLRHIMLVHRNKDSGPM
jgi:hypothetical protein